MLNFYSNINAIKHELYYPRRFVFSRWDPNITMRGSLILLVCLIKNIIYVGSMSFCRWSLGMKTRKQEGNNTSNDNIFLSPIE